MIKVRKVNDLPGTCASKSMIMSVVSVLYLFGLEISKCSATIWKCTAFIVLLAEFIGRVTSGTNWSAMCPGASVVVSPLGYTTEHISSVSSLEWASFVMTYVAVQVKSVFFLNPPISDGFGSSCRTSLFSSFHSSVESAGRRCLISWCRNSKLIYSVIDPLSQPAGIGFSS
jgi:hypothetical protein